MRRATSQAGASLAFALVMISAFTSLVIVGWVLDGAGKRLGRAAVTSEQFESLSTSLVTYVAQYRRLPCPANPAAFDGLEVRVGDNCQFRDGIFPWRTLGHVETQALDGWGRHYSYRVFDGAIGLVRDDGLNMAECDTDNSPASNKPAGVSRLCDGSHNVLDQDFLLNKGLTVEENGVSRPVTMAFVLVSHGETGYGAYLPGVNGGRMPVPTQGGGDFEYQNTRATGTYYVRTTTPGTPPDNANHFDDQLKFMTIAEVVRSAALMPRDWPDTPLSFNAETTANMTTPGTDHFLSTGSGGTAFQSYVSSGDYGVEFGVASGSSYAGCLWWPQSFSTTTTKKTLRIAFRFSADGAGSGPNPGLIVGFLPGSAAITNALCGDNTTAGIGWSGGTLPAADRFGVEIDMSRNFAAANDPVGTHLALDFVGTNHDGNLAATCIGPGCDSQGAYGWLRDGISHLHAMRVEVVPNSLNCLGKGPEVEAWVVSEDFCSSNAAVCNHLLDTTTDFSTFPAPQDSESLHIKACVPNPPTPLTAYNNLYFGFTTRNTSGSASGVNLRLQNLTAGVY